MKTNHLSIGISSVSDTLVEVVPLSSNKGIAHWRTAEIPNGVYFYELKDSKQSYGKGKVVIAK